ncbi:hypothetical protein [Paenibacillus kobensis]|uniref:hypothetical protein n=1 Tax=Paenibacillus kobensis TaxID=59841 RepID=UPI000FDB9E1B|nr:hypothetical protein [Paenibacillus kobensis]
MRMIIAIVFMLALLTGCGAGTSAKEPLTLQQVTDALQAEGLLLEDDAPVNPDSIFQQGIDGVKPRFYRLADGIVYIYLFETNDKRIQGYEHFYDRPLDFEAHHTHEVNNVFIVFTGGHQKGDTTDDRIKAALKRLE